jgi:hypothetical protein
MSVEELVTTRDFVAPTNEEEWLFLRLEKCFVDLDDEEAALLCRQVIELGGEKMAEAQSYLALLEQRSDELFFAEATHLFKLGRQMQAYRQFHRVSSLKKGRQVDADRYIKIIEPHLEVAGFRDGKPHLPAFSDLAEVGGTGLESKADSNRPTEATIRRTPHMDIRTEAHVQPGSTINISVFVDKTAARVGEDSDELAFAASPGVNDFDVEVRLLATGHFIIEGSAQKNILIERDHERSNSAEFKVRVKPEIELTLRYSEMKAGLTAVFAYKGRISGRVTRTVQIADATTPATEKAGTETAIGPAAGEVKPDEPWRMKADIFANAADLNVVIIAQPTNDGRHFWCIVQTPLLEKYRNGIADEWNLPDVTANIVSDSMAEFTTGGMGKEQRLASLRGAGITLFEASPKPFQKVFWELIDEGRIPRTIAIVSEEPYLPWELMIPKRKVEGQPRQRPSLGVEFIIARWTPKQAMSGRQKIPMTDCYVIAPQYTNKPTLPYAQAELAFMLQKYPAPAGQAVKPANFENLSATFKSGGKTIVHFACHGANSATGKQLIYLESDPPVSPKMLRGMCTLEQAFVEKHPFVFLNACEVGRQVPNLSGVGGFAQSFIDLGASAVIAPLWSVKDDLAHQIALDFYNSIAAFPHKPFAEILSEIRAKAYDPQIAEDTYAAYCFYGDPLGSLASN